MEALAPLWNELLGKQRHSFFQRFSWNRLAAEVFCDRLTPFVVSVQSDNGAAIIPAAINNRNGDTELLGELLFDYRDVLHLGEREVLRTAWQKLATLGRPLHVLSISQTADGGRWARFPLELFARAPMVEGAHLTEEAFRLQHSRLGRQMRRLQKQGAVLRCSSGHDSRLLRHLYNCKRSQFAANQENVFTDCRRGEFMVAAAGLEGSSCEVYALETNALLVAGLVTFRDDHIRRFYTTYFNPEWARYSPGQALLYEITAQSLGNGLSCDFMTGEYPYKLRLANASQTLFRLDLSAEQLVQISRRVPASSAA